MFYKHLRSLVRLGLRRKPRVQVQQLGKWVFAWWASPQLRSSTENIVLHSHWVTLKPPLRFIIFDCKFLRFISMHYKPRSTTASTCVSLWRRQTSTGPNPLRLIGVVPISRLTDAEHYMSFTMWRRQWSGREFHRQLGFIRTCVVCEIKLTMRIIVLGSSLHIPPSLGILAC
jgi:hypothetical protein